MREKKRCRWLALLLAVVMLLSVLPTAVFAARDTSNDEFYKIVHLDCGRKYFTKDWIIALINEVAYDGYNQLQLAFGNDGLRFLLNDMSFTANGTNYSHTDVVKAVEQGNANQNSSGDSRYLTQSEMDEIIAAANAKGIEIVPLLNLPGHANAILDIAGDAYNASGSNNTLNVTSGNARDFGYAIFTKYVDYFAEKGCKFFNFGADEYANDASGAFSFNRLDEAGYNDFVGYINLMAGYIEGKQMTPRAFNDGLYYGNWTGVSIDTDIQCCYWSNGWNGYSPAAASTVAGKGHAMINTNGDYYYVLGKDDEFDSGYSKASEWDNTAFMGSTVSNPAGSMFCIWCDYPNAENETQIAANTRLVMRAMAAEMNGEDANAIDTNAVVPGGFNADGTINTTSSGDSADTTDVINLTAGDTVSRTISGFNYENNVDRSKLDETIATVIVEGVDAVEGGTEYTEASVTCNTLISSDSNNWTLVSDYYYTPDGTNYYPVYAKRSSSWSWSSWSYTYTYTWGYSATSSTSGVTQIGTQSTTSTSTTPNITVYTQRTTAPSVASTTITFNGVYPGTTYVTVGGTEYEINVAYKTENVSVVVDGSKTVPQESTIKGNAVVDDPSVVSVSTSGNNVTFSGLKVGTTTVTVGDTRYTVTVSEEDLTGKTLTIEYWITNGRPTDANGNKSCTVNATASGVYSESGADIASLLPANTTKESRTLQFWRGRLLDTTSENSSTSGTEEQTEDAGDDETYGGVEFTKVRYWNGVWSVYTKNDKWVEVAAKHQLVAYYLEILPVSDELNVYAADWGKKADGSSSGDYLEPASSCTISVIAVYEDGTTNPASTSAADLKGSTIAYGYWTSGRGIGTLNLVGQEGYQIWKIEAETGSETYTSNSSTWGSFTVDTFTWDNNPMTVYEGDAVDKYTLHNDSNNPSKDDYYQNLMWDENREAILLKVYLKAKPTADSLTVHYIDKTANQEFYNYNINVIKGTTFNTGFALDPGYTEIDNALVNNTVTNSLGVVQTVTANLSKMPEISAQYRYSTYTCVEVHRSDDGKEVYLYYTFDNTHKFVIDFGLPLTIDREMLSISGDWTSSSVSHGKYGTVEKNDTTQSFTYTPNSVLLETDAITLTLSNGTENVSHQIYIYPASNVLYEAEKFTTAGNAWTTTVKYDDTANSCWDCLEDYLNTVYGYTEEYASSVGAGKGGGVYAVLSKNQFTDDLSFSFKGTGFDLIAQCGATTGTLMVRVDNSKGYYKSYLVDTSFSDQNIVDGNGYIYQVPVIHAQDWPEDTYTVTVRGANIVYGAASNSNANTASTFSMRSAGASAMDTIYALADRMGLSGDDLDSMEFINVDQLYGASTYAMASAVRTASTDTADTQADATMTLGIDAFRVYRDTSNSAYKTGEKGMVYVNVLDAVNGSFVGYVESTGDNTYNSGNYESNGGPQNEIYLSAGNAATFQTDLEKGAVVQVSARAVTGTAILNDNTEGITSNTEMYYEVTVGKDGVITIANGKNATGMLAIANLKVPADTDFETPTEQTFVTAFAMMRSYSAAPTEPDPEQPGIEEPAPTPVFTPETFKTRVNSIRTRSKKIVTLTITASTDVDHVVVNGKTYYPMNKLLVKWGLSKTYVFTIMDTAGASETRSFEIVAYNADGLASSTYTDAG